MINQISHDDIKTMQLFFLYWEYNENITVLVKNKINPDLKVIILLWKTGIFVQILSQ